MAIEFGINKLISIQFGVNKSLKVTNKMKELQAEVVR